MSTPGIFPRRGVPFNETLNGVDVDTTCSEQELFFPVGRCPVRLDPHAYNALLSELLNMMASLDHTYDCERLDNLAVALENFSTVIGKTATETFTDSFGNTVRSGDQYLEFPEGETLVVTDNTDTYATVAAATENGTDNFGRDYETGDPLVTFPGGTVATIPESVDTFAVASQATEAGSDSFGSSYEAGDRIITFPSGTILHVPANTDEFATAAAADNVGTDSFGTDYEVGDPVISFPDGTVLAVQSAPSANLVTSMVYNQTTGVLNLAQSGGPDVPVTIGNAKPKTAEVSDEGPDVFGNTIEEGDELLILSNGDKVLLTPPASPVLGFEIANVDGTDTLTRPYLVGDTLAVYTNANGTTLRVSCADRFAETGVAGRVEVATANEVGTIATTGSTGASLVLTPGNLSGVPNYQIPFDGDAQLAGDHVLLRDGSTNKFRWISIQDLLNAV